MKKDIGFRFSEEVHEALKRKSENWAMTRTAFLERLISLAPVHPEPELGSKPIDPAELGAFEKELSAHEREAKNKVAGMRDLHIPPPSNIIRTYDVEAEEVKLARPRIDPDKIDAAQRKMAQSQKGRKK